MNEGVDPVIGLFGTVFLLGLVFFILVLVVMWVLLPVLVYKTNQLLKGISAKQEQTNELLSGLVAQMGSLIADAREELSREQEEQTRRHE